MNKYGYKAKPMRNSLSQENGPQFRQSSSEGSDNIPIEFCLNFVNQLAPQLIESALSIVFMKKN